jgi:hypothetical protein
MSFDETMRRETGFDAAGAVIGVATAGATEVSTGGATDAATGGATNVSTGGAAVGAGVAIWKYGFRMISPTGC